MSFCNSVLLSLPLLHVDVDGGILYEVTLSSPTVTGGHCYGNCHMTDHPLSMTYQIHKWPVIRQIKGKNVIILFATTTTHHKYKWPPNNVVL